MEELAPLSWRGLLAVLLFWVVYSLGDGVAAYFLVLAGVFWFQWALPGSLDVDFVANEALALWVLVAILLIAGSVRGWTWKLMTGAWREPGGNGGNYPVTVF